jgi:TPR repeat protein
MNTTDMQDLTELNIDLSSGIAAYEAKHFFQAMNLLSPLAELGDAQAQYRLAIMAQNGLGMHKNPLLAFRYMQAAANQGYALAQHGLGFMYKEGDCAVKDQNKALEWFKLAAAQGLEGSKAILESMVV